MIWRLIRKNISVPQMAGYVLASIIGLAILLCALKFYADAHAALYGDDAASNRYMVLSKPVNMLGSLAKGKAPSISAEDLDDLRSQPWVEDAASFEAANFGVSASIGVQGRNMWTHLFLEAVPDQFLDVQPQDWSFDPAIPNAEVPIIIPRDYLSLYNYGYAASRGLTQISEDVVTQIPFSLYLNGNGHSDNRSARIVGFSDRLNTIAVPLEFMQWANNRYSNVGAEAPSRIIVKVSDPGNPEIAAYLKANGLDPAANSLDQGKGAFFIKLASTAVAAVGAVICALALFILVLSISLLLQKNREKTRMLLLLGYSPWQVARCYVRMVVGVNLLVFVVAGGIMLVASAIWSKPLQAIGLHSSSPLWPLAVGLGVMAVITLVNVWSINRSVKVDFFYDKR